jgi:hypothetical protein
MTTLQFQLGGTLKLLTVEEPKPVGAVKIKTTYEGFSLTATGDIMYTLGVDHEVEMQVSYVDKAGNPATVDGPVQWVSSNPAIATTTVDATDSTLVTVTPVGPLGQVQVTATADADIGAGVTQLVTNADITIVAGQAVSGTISPVGAPIPIL